ncbi:hypothetical protein D0A34_14685 [Microcoleus vaginatus PCC 9802]|nr:hypothetical protein D0A34_14685 [Microcoleus vaginatus PCC 9802]
MVRKKEEGRRKKEEGRRKKENAIKSMVSAIKNVFNADKVAILMSIWLEFVNLENILHIITT